ncbi:MAG: hypothetical protein AAFN10_02210 [Bacteroidota bacterium]
MDFSNRLYRFRRPFWGTLILCLALFACKQSPNSQASIQEAEVETPNNEELVVQDTVIEDSIQTRGLGANARLGFDFAAQFPLIDSLSQSQTEGRRLIGSFAAAVAQANSIETSEQLESLLFERRDQAREQLQSLIENQDPAWLDQNYQALEDELNRLGMSMLFAEGMFIGLGNTTLLTELVETKGSDALKWYLQFIYASDESANGEYPFLDMRPYGSMIVAGERLQSIQPNPYFEKIEDQYQRAILCMADIHRVGAPTARTDEKQLMVGGINTEHYPFATGAESRQNFAEGQNSRYGPVLAKIMANMSEMSEEPEHLYAIITEWVDGEAMAKNRVYSHLEAGVDIPHYLKIRRSNGADAYGIVYRFYDDAEKAEAAISKIEQEIETAELRMLSVRNGELYEMESAMN